MKQVNINNVKKTSGIRQSLTLKGSRYGTSTSALTAASGTAPSSPDTASALSTTSQEPLMRIMLHGIYVGHHFDGVTRGGTGEFYWYSSVADGNDLYVIDSRQSNQFGKNGILTGVNEKTWIDFGLLELFRSRKAPERKNTVFSFSLKESDDGDEAKAIFREAAGVARVVAEKFAGSDLADAEKRAVNLFNAIIDADDDDDAIQGIKGLDYLTNYDIGRFFRLEGKQHDNRPTFAICSVVPLVDPGGEDFAFYEEIGLSVSPPKGKELIVNAPQDGYLSIMMRVRSGNAVMLTGPGNKRLSSPAWTVIKTISVKKGKYPLTLNGFVYPSKVDLRVMYTSGQLKQRYV